MAIQFSVAARNASLDAIETAVGVSPTFELRSGAAPATCAAADSGTLLASMALPADWMAAAANGSKALLGSWQDIAADAAGIAGHFRIKQGDVCHMQGSASDTAGSGDLKLDNTNIAVGQQVIISGFTLTAGGA